MYEKLIYSDVQSQCLFCSVVKYEFLININSYIFQITLTNFPNRLKR